MKRFACTSFVILMAVLLASCQFPFTKIQPGDKIGDTLFLSDYEQCQAPNFNDICGGFDTLVDGTCEIPADLTTFWISTGWSEPTQEELENAWTNSEWSLTYDDYKIDLPAFGTYDMKYEEQPARAWNVCISNPTPGKHTVVYKIHFEHGSRPGNHTNPLSFTVLAPEP
jgi:hypothetical protein